MTLYLLFVINFWHFFELATTKITRTTWKIWQSWHENQGEGGNQVIELRQHVSECVWTCEWVCLFGGEEVATLRISVLIPPLLSLHKPSLWKIKTLTGNFPDRSCKMQIVLVSCTFKLNIFLIFFNMKGRRTNRRQI